MGVYLLLGYPIHDGANGGGSLEWAIWADGEVCLGATYKWCQILFQVMKLYYFMTI